MARYTGPVCRLCRRERMKLFLKGERCFKEKCAIERRGYPPGQHGQRRGRRSLSYGLQLREKQKVKRIYGILEQQFRIYFQEAERRKGITGENLLILLERRLDNVVYSLGFASSRAQARQLVRHGHITVDGRKITIPSFQVREARPSWSRKAAGRTTSSAPPSRARAAAASPTGSSSTPSSSAARCSTLPKREDIKLPIQEQLIVELYSR